MPPVTPMQSFSPRRKHSESNAPLFSITQDICRPILFLGKILGLISFDLTCSQNKTRCYFFRRMLCQLYKISVVIVTAYLLCDRAKDIAHRAIIYANATDGIASAVRKVGNSLELISICLLCLWKERQFCNLTKLLGNIDRFLERKIQKLRFLLQNAFLHGIITIFGLTTLTVIHSVRANGSEVFWDIVFGFQLYLGECFIVLLFVLSANLCAQGFSTLNYKLYKALTFNVLSAKYLDQLRLNYDQLYRISCSIQDTFSWLITAVIINNSLMLCSLWYAVLTAARITLWRAYFIVRTITAAHCIFILTTAAGNITTQAKNGGEYLSSIPCNTLSSIEGKILILSNKLIHYPPEIHSVGSLITINRNTFTTIMGTIITYLIVMMQFRSSNVQSSKETNANMTYITN